MDMRFGDDRVETTHREVTAMLERLEPKQQQAVIARLAVSARAAGAPLGECRLHGKGDYPPVRPVLEKDGLHWCCISDDPHCSEAVVPLVKR